MGYRVLKGKSHSATVSIENTEANTSIMIGCVSIKMLNILEKTGRTVSDDTLNLHEEWNFDVNYDTAMQLATLAMEMKKPKTTPKVKPLETPEGLPEKPRVKQSSTKKIDAMDVLLGLADYN